MKKFIVVAVMMVVAVTVAGNSYAATSKKHKAKHHSSNGDVKGGGYHNGGYHIRKAGEPDKLDLKWGGVDNPVKGMKASAKKPPATTPSQSPNP